MDRLRDVSFTFCPEFRRQAQVEHFLAQSAENIGHPWQDDRKYILVKRASPDGVGEPIIHCVDITDVDTARFMSDAQMSELGEMVARGMDALKGHLGDITEYTTTMVAPGNIFSVPLNEGKIAMFTMTDQSQGTWFDMSLYRENPQLGPQDCGEVGVEVLSYNHKTISGWRHSGDLRSPPFALHHVSPVNVGGQFVEGIVTGTPVGFNTTPLVGFVQQQPFWAVVDHDQKVIYVVPLPLEEVTLGTRSTAAHMMVARVSNTRDGGELQVRVPDVIRHVPGINTSNTTDPGLIVSVREAIADFVVGTETALPGPVGPVREAETERPSAREAAAAAAIERVSGKAGHAEEPPIKNPVTILCQNGLGSPFPPSGYFDGATVLGFDTGYTKEVVTENRNQIVLPVTSRVLKGAACALGTKPDCDVPEFGHGTIVILGTDKEAMTDANSRLVNGDGATWLNAVFIVAADVPDPGQADSAAAVEHMNHMNVCGVNAIAGPGSTVLIRYTRQTATGVEPIHRYYRGLRLLPWSKVPDYGEEVPFDQEVFQAVMADHRASPPGYPVHQSIHSKEVWWNDKMTSIDQLMQEFLGYDYQMFWALRDSIIELFDQLKVVLDSKEVRDFITKLNKYLEGLIDQEVIPLKTQIKEVYSADPSSFEGGQEEKDKLLKKLSSNLKGTKKSLGKSIRFVADALSKLTSARGVTKHYQSIKAAARANAIKSNVADASSMTLIERLEYLTTICDTLFVIRLEEASLKAALTYTRDEKLLEVLARWDPTDQGAMPMVLRQDERTRTLDSDTYAIIGEMAGGLNQTPASGDKNLTVPAHNEPPGLYQASLGIPLVNRMVALEDPGTLKWTDVCNEADMAWWRIWVRRTLADCFNRIMDVRGKQLGFLLIHIFLCGMESIASGMMGLPDPSEFEGVEPEDLPTTTQAMRALEAQLFSTAASTQTTVNPIYQLCYMTGKMVLPKTDDEWWIYIRYMRVMSFIGRPLEVQNRIFHNFRQVIAKLVWNKVLDQAVTKLNKESKKDKQAPKVKNPEWLAYVHLVVEVIFQVSRGEVQMTKDLAGRLLDLSPPQHILSRGTMMMTSFMYARKYLVGVYKGGNPAEGFLRAVAVALFSFVKHSNLVHGDKKKIRAQIAAAKTALEMRKIYDLLVVESSVRAKKGSPGYQAALEAATEKGPQFPTKWLSYKVEPETHAQRLQGVLASTEIPKIPEEVEVEAAEAELAIPVTLRETFESMTGSDQVIKVLDRLDKDTSGPRPGQIEIGITGPLGKIPIYELISIACRGRGPQPGGAAPEKNPVLVYRQLVHAMLAEHKDYDGAIAAGMLVLML